MERHINKDLFIGGFDWATEALQGIDNDTYTAGVGGHFMQVAWALVKIYDLHNKMPAFPLKNNLPSYPLQLIDRNNINDYRVLLNSPDWSKIDFHKFTLSVQKAIASYQFDFERILHGLNN